jgi:hypothetical protein
MTTTKGREMTSEEKILTAAERYQWSAGRGALYGMATLVLKHPDERGREMLTITVTFTDAGHVRRAAFQRRPSGVLIKNVRGGVPAIVDLMKFHHEHGV